ncbi:MAG: acylphosphatase [Aquificaceae bacterium]|nr:acylphosphatase [Aquificaceae bacterium]MDW8237275.1 acylphosphatase [Aquificaceae bacterium]
MLVFRVFVEGKVQGVGFRAFVRDRAVELGLSGWVKNLPDGRVEALLAGEEGRVWECIVAISKGPERAKVESLCLLKEVKDDVKGGFSITY